MAGTVLSRPSHYDTLGLEPTASQAEIERAFAWGVSPFRPRPIGGVAQVSIAYQALRDPERRRAYDKSIGIRPEPKPAPRPLHSGASFRIAAPVHASERFGLEGRAALTAERAVGSFIAASLRTPVEVVAVPEAEPEPVPVAIAAVEPVVVPAPERVPRLPEDEAGETGINRTALGVGGVVLAVVLAGAWAGLEAGRSGRRRASEGGSQRGAAQGEAADQRHRSRACAGRSGACSPAAAGVRFAEDAACRAEAEEPRRTGRGEPDATASQLL